MTKQDVATRDNGGQGRMSHWDWGPFEALHEDIDRLFGRYFEPSSRRPFALLRGRSNGMSDFAQMDVRETDDAIEIKLDVPGMDVGDIDVTLTDKQLTIKGERKEESEEKKGDYYRMERSFGSFQRQIDLPTEIDDQNIDASVKSGVLSVVLPKSEKAKRHEKKIDVKSS